MTPYEMFFFSSGAVESRWRPKDLIEVRVNVLVGFPLGGLLALAIQAVAFLVFSGSSISRKPPCRWRSRWGSSG
jgi:manganese transport protein